MTLTLNLKNRLISRRRGVKTQQSATSRICGILLLWGTANAHNEFGQNFELFSIPECSISAVKAALH